jgi:hypothetical protein
MLSSQMKLILSFLALTFSFSSFADEIYQESAVEVCQQLKQKSYSKKCMAQIKKVKYNETALAYCAKQSSWNKIKSCLEIIPNKQYQEESLAICHTAKYYNNEFKQCMNEIAEKYYISKIEIGLCNDEKTYKKKIKCLKTASYKDFHAVAEEKKVNHQQQLADLQNKIKNAYELLRANKTSDATIMLHEIVKGFE